mmetsp:Transcript_31527/g.27914  ORF Transcript_31527/g.27914 Transcript_31527/m.27914 type:complete len:199 (-) Transcript_31527:69-665(-)
MNSRRPSRLDIISSKTPKVGSALEINTGGVFGKYLNKVSTSALLLEKSNSTRTSGFSILNTKIESRNNLIAMTPRNKIVSLPIGFKNHDKLKVNALKARNDLKIKELLVKFNEKSPTKLIDKRRSLVVNTNRTLPRTKSLAELKKFSRRSVVFSTDRNDIKGPVLFDPTQKGVKRRHSSLGPRARSQGKCRKRKSGCG